MQHGELYFRTAGKRLCAYGGAMAVVAVVTMFLFGRFGMMTLLAPLPLLGIGLGMIAAPGGVIVERGVRGEDAWVRTSARHRVVWLAGLVLGLGLGLGLWMLLIPFVVMS